MNNSKRARLKKAISQLEDALSITSEVLSDEQFDIDSIPENLESSEIYRSMEDSIDNLEDSVDSISSAIDSINSAM